MKYIDPTYMIRAVPTNPNDRIYCKVCSSFIAHCEALQVRIIFAGDFGQIEFSSEASSAQALMCVMMMHSDHISLTADTAKCSAMR